MRICQTCQKEFEPSGAQRKYCSRECSLIGYKNQKRRYRNPIVQACGFCGKEFSIDKAGRKYCSRKCYTDAMVGHTHTPKMRVVNACVVCGKEFETGGRAGKRDKRYCSRECRNWVRYRTGAKANQIDALDAAYIAGFFDGEGSVIASLNRGIVQIKITITNTHEGIIRWLREVTGIGTISYKKSKVEQHRDVFTWACNSEAASAILEQIGPYLRIKTKQADLASATQKRLREPAQKADRAWQGEVCEQMRFLNHRGSRLGINK